MTSSSLLRMKSQIKIFSMSAELQAGRTCRGRKMSRDSGIDSLGQPIGFFVPNWTRRPDPPSTPMEGRTCRLEPLDPEKHVQDLYDSFSEDAEGRNWTYIYGPLDFSSLHAWFRRAVAETGRLHMAVVDRKTNRAVGMACYIYDPENGAMEIGIIRYSPVMQRTTSGTEAMYLMLRRVFDELGYRRCAWQCEILNAESMSAARRFGFSFEGVVRQDSVYKGRNRDTAWFSIIDSEWPKIRKAYEKWLAPENFDEEGNQREKLSDLMRHLD